MQIKVKKLDERAILPTRGTLQAAGMDIYALESVSVNAGETVLVHTGIALAIPEGYAGFIYARSGIATKRGLAPANKVGVIDADYRGEVMVALHNHSGESRTIDHGERIAQLVLVPYLTAAYEQADSLTDTVRGDGGFGSTGSK